MGYRVIAPGGSRGYSKPTVMSRYIHTVPQGYTGLQRKAVSGDKKWVKLAKYGTETWNRVRELAWMPKTTMPKVRTLADRALEYVLAAWFDNPDRLLDYIWGAEGDNADHSKSGDPEWDCSGLFYAMLRYAGYKIARMTAHDYSRMMHPISAPSEVGDVAFHFNSAGHATHIVIYTDDGYFIEARGAAYGIERHKVTTAASRGLKWYRSDKINAYLAQTV